MALKKPSDFFGNNKKTPLDEVKESYESARPEKIEQVSEAFDAFKSNLNHLQSLSDFTSTFDSFKSNLEKVESVSSEVSGIKEEIKSLIKKEDLDSAMMAQLLFVEQSISKIESKVSSINGKTVDSIREDFANLSDTVNGFLSVDVPKYKKLIAESEVRTDSRFATFKEGIEENLDEIKVDVNKEVATALESIESVNENTINIVKAEVKETVRDVNKKVNELVEKELPKYKKLFAETEVKTEEKINSAIHSYKSTIENLSERVKEFTEEEIPKYSNLLIETKLKSEKEVKQLEEEVLSRVKTLSEKVESLSEDVEQKTFERVESLQDVVKEYKEEIEFISKRYETLQKDFTGRVVHEDKKLSQYSKKFDKFSKRFSFIEETLTEDVRELKENLETNTSKFYTELKSEIDGVEQNIAQTVKDLEVNIVINESHLKKQNEYIGNIQEEVKEVLDKLQLDVLEKKNAQLVERINHVEEVFSKINEKTLLTEDNPTLPGDPSTNNSGDPLTPLDQKFVTLDQLQNHYRTFINRIQQQIATIGGGGAGFIKDLDDVTFNESTGENQLLIYNGSKWVGIASAALSSGSGGDADSASKLVLDVRNNNIGYALTIGTPVYQTAYNSGLDRLDVEESRASNSVTMPAKGVVSTDLANNTSGQIIVYGELEGVNTQAFDVGDELFVAPGGGLTNVRPTDPTHLVQKIAVVLKKSTANGAILVYGAGRTNDVPNNISIAGSITAVDGFFSGNVTVGGTITYEDVKNVDSLGIVTARTGVDVLAGGINVTGVSTFNDQLKLPDNTKIMLGASNDMQILHIPGVGNIIQGDSPLKVQSTSQIILSEYNGSEVFGKFIKNGAVELYHDNSKQFETTGAGATVYGTTETQQLNVTGVSTISTGVGTVHVGVGSTTLLVDGDARVTGILTIGSGSITLDPTAKKIEGIDEIIIGTGTTVRIHQDTSGEIAFSDREGKQASVGIGTTVSINTTGIITATTFDGSLATSNLSGTITNDQLAGSIGNAKLANSSIAIGGITLNLGDTDDTPAFDLSDATNYPFTSITGIATVISGDTTPTLGGNLNLNSKTINGTGNVNITGIITASSFSGDGSGLTGVASTDNIITGTAATFNNVVKVGTGITLDATSGIVTATGVNVIGIVTATSFVGDGSNLTGISTFSGDYNDLTNTPTIPTNNNQLTNGAGYITTSFTSTSQLTNDAGFITNNVSGVLTATSFSGDGSQLSNIISGVGIKSTSTRIGTGFTDINFTGAGITVVGSGTTVTVNIPSSTITRQTETSSGVTTDFTVTGGYTVGLLDVFVNGVKQINGSDFTATDGSTVTMTPNVTDGDVVEFQKYDKLNIAGITSVTNATNAYNIVGTDFSLNASGIITASQLAVSGLSTSKDLLVTGITSATNIIEIKSNDSTPGRIDLYCETNNAHYARLQAPEHGDFGGNITVKLPASTGTLLLSDGSGASLTSLNASNLGSGTIPDARFPATLPAISGQNLTGIVTGITAGSNITVLESPSGNFIITATGGGGGDTVSINASAGDILSASSGEISADDAGSDKLVFWDDSESKLTYLTAGSGLSISGTTITASGGGGSSGVEIENNGTSVGTGITAINFSTNVTATASGGIATVTASGGGGGGSDGPSSVMMGMIF